MSGLHFPVIRSQVWRTLSFMSHCHTQSIQQKQADIWSCREVSRWLSQISTLVKNTRWPGRRRKESFCWHSPQNQVQNIGLHQKQQVGSSNFLDPKIIYFIFFNFNSFVVSNIQHKSAESNNAYSMIACLSRLQAEHLNASFSKTLN